MVRPVRRESALQVLTLLQQALELTLARRRRTAGLVSTRGGVAAILVVDVCTPPVLANCDVVETILDRRQLRARLGVLRAALRWS
jgi:hypothetical protein